MSEPQIMTFKAGANRDFVERLLGRRKKNAISRATAVRLESGLRKLPELLQPRLVYTVEEPAHIGNGQVHLKNGLVLASPKLAWSLKGAQKLVFFVATVGAKIDREIEELMAAGRLADSYVLDALGSGAVEWVADRFQDSIEEKYEERELQAGLRFSPGYCDWPLVEQKKMFTLLETGKVGVELGDTCLMSPRKSVSAVFGLYPPQARPQSRHMNPCRRCAKGDCLARRAEN
jgi:hypothetical protein